MNKRLVIAGAGGFGRGVYNWVTQSSRYLRHHRVAEVAFIDDSFHPETPSARVFSTIRDYRPRPTDLVLCAIASPLVRSQVVDSLAARGAVFHTFIDDRAILGENVKVGLGAVICPGVVISDNVTLGDHVHINFNCSIGHDATFARFATLSPSVNVMGEVAVEDGVFIGGSATMLPRITLGRQAVIGAGSVCLQDVPAGQTVVGNPARAPKGAVT